MKALAALISSSLVYLLLPLGITEDTSLGTAIEIIILSGLTAATVYLVPNRK